MRNPPEDDDEEQISDTTGSTVAAIEAPPVDQTQPNMNERY